MTATTPTALEGAFQRYSDDLYRLALLLTSDDAHAAAALHSAMRRLADTPLAVLKEPAMIAALIAALPPERRRPWQRRLPTWARLPAGRDEAALLAALAQLPHQQRLALGLTFVRGFEAAQAAPILGGDEAHLRALVRDALRALAPHVTPELATADLDLDRAPEACRSTRAALALGGDLVHTDPATRGHLALCGACRAAEQTWLRLNTAVENALRGALRNTTLPEHLAEELRAALVRAPLPARRNPLADERARLIALALAVLVVIALLVLPRRPPAVVSTGGTAGASMVLAPRDLVGRALDRVYTPPGGSGVWHGRWEIRWSFANGSYAPLNADEWVDTATSRHRVQLVHYDGGGPFEFELADEAGNVWYATTANYAPSLYPSLLDANHLRTHLRLTPADQQQMLRARLGSGAWDLASAYLRQARDARDLRSWGRQRAEDGATLEVLGFGGFSPLSQPVDAPDSAAVPTTILLSIDIQSGALREVRELTGPEGGERNARTTWRFVGNEWLTSTQEIAAAFDRRRAWNGAGDFDEGQGGAADPALPLIAANRTMSLAQALPNRAVLWIPSAAPPGATRALLLTVYDPSGNIQGNLIVYIGPGRRLTISQLAEEEPTQPMPAGGETITLNGDEFVLQPTSAQGYRARAVHAAPYYREVITRIEAQGYTRAELLDILRSFGPPTVEAYRGQARLFADPKPRDQASFDALLGALAPLPPPPAGTVRHFVERRFTRHVPGPDPRGDPYHLPPYGGRPQELLTDNWVRAAANGAPESSAAEHDADGTIYSRQYLGATTVWYYDAPTSQANRVRASDLPLMNQINIDQALVFDLLARGGTRLASLPDGTRVISSRQPLLESRFRNVWDVQQQDSTAGGPYLGDLSSDAVITTSLYLGADGRPKRIEARASGTAPRTVLQDGRAQDGILLESWELVSDQQIPADRVPAHTFDPNPPEAIDFEDPTTQQVPPFSEPETITVTEALQRATTPLWYLQPDDKNGPLMIEAVVSSANHSQLAGGDVFEGALRRGLALRFRNWLPTNAPTQRLTYIYEGAAEPFRTFIRARSAWYRWQSSSAPVQFRLGKRTVDGWRMTTWQGAIWTLFELDGTLLAMQTNDDLQQAALERLQPLQRP